MHNEFTAIIERDDEWYVAYCPEVPGANGPGRTKEEARGSLASGVVDSLHSISGPRFENEAIHGA